MIQIANFTQTFIRELYKLTKMWGTSYVTEDGNIRQRERDAIARVTSKTKMAKLNGDGEDELRYIRVDMGINFPQTVEELKQMFEDQDTERRKARRNDLQKQLVPKPVFTDEDAEAELAKLAEARKDLTKKAVVEKEAAKKQAEKEAADKKAAEEAAKKTAAEKE